MGPEADSRMFCADKIGPERRDVENNHDQRKKVHSHGYCDHDVHRAHAEEPNLSCSGAPNKKWISDLQQTNEDSCQREHVLECHEDFGINFVKWRPDESAPDTGTIPPARTKALGEAAKKIDDT